MENKNNKKSSFQQLQALVEYMEEHPELARGSVVYGSSKMAMEEQWIQLAKKLNSMGPPIRAIVEWKKTWADLKSRTKKKIAENNKSLRETGGGIYRMSKLTELEETVNRTLCLIKSAAPSGNMFGYPDCQNLVDQTNDFNILKESPPRSSTVVAAITPTRRQNKSQSALPNEIDNIVLEVPAENDWFLPLEPSTTQQSTRKRKSSESENELPGCSSAKKLKASNEQISLIRKQIRITESSAAAIKEQSEATKTLAEATKALVSAVTRIADAVEIQADAVRKNAETQERILASIDAIRYELVDYFSKQ